MCQKFKDGKFTIHQRIFAANFRARCSILQTDGNSGAFRPSRFPYHFWQRLSVGVGLRADERYSENNGDCLPLKTS